MKFKLWLSENEQSGNPINLRSLGKALLKNTCGDKPCSKGSSPWWALHGDQEALKSPNLVPINTNMDSNIKTAYNPDKSILVVVFDTTNASVQGLPKINPKELVEELTKKIYINQSQILSSVNDYNQKQKENRGTIDSTDFNSKKFSKIDYFRYYPSKSAYILEYKIS